MDEPRSGGPGRPRVVVTTTASLDGRITPSRAERLLEKGVFDRWRAAWPGDVDDLHEQRRAWIEEHHAPTVTLEGSGTFVADEVESAYAPAGSAPDDDLPADHLPRRAPRWFVVVDARGRVDWTYFGDDTTALLVLVCRSTPPGYLARLREVGVGYLVVGDERVDLAMALQRLGDTLGATCVVSDGGGGLNGALLRAGLVDELHVVTFPALVGGLGTPSFVDGPPLSPGGEPTRVRPLGVVTGAGGSTWARYAVDPS
ncbi:RibD family protein [Intrasporangium flavum]|uniref:RibD family protein n=1 Tax=Intrasporangium flavum TaxID=1428657 RepID=UPI00096E3B9E|nr:dihydrofolate reductase family protein [Intrasporangium flavum]